ncbi:hypothetical protein Tco_0155047 [Tanacetum coccineum]
MAAFKVLETQFQMFIKSRIYLDDEYVVMTHNYFLQYNQLKILEFHDTLIQHIESVKKSIDKRALHKREYDNWMNERQMQTTEEKVDTSNALDASLVDIKSSGTELKEQDTSSRSGNDAHADADIRPIYDEEPMAEVQLIVDHNMFATRQHHVEQPEFNNEGEVDQNAEQCHDKLDVNNDLPKPVTTHYLPKGKESACVKPHHMIAPGSSRWVPTGKIFTSSTTKVDSEPTNGSNDDITNQYECKQTLDVSAGTLNIHAGTSLNPTKEGLRVCSELGIHDHSNEQSSSKLVPKGSFSRQDSYIMTRVRITIPPSHNNAEKTYALSWNPGQGDLLNLPDTGYIKMEMVMPHSSEELEYGYLPSWAMRIIFGSDSWLLVLSYEMDGYRVVVGLVLAMRWRAANFEIKHGLLTLVQNKSSSGHDKEDHMPTSVTSIKSPPTLRYPNVPTTSISCCFFFSLYEGQPGYGLKKNPSDQFRTWMTSSAKVIIQFFSTFKRQNLRNEITNFKLRFGKFDGGGYVSDFEVGSDSKIFSEHVQFQGCSELSN